MDIVTLIHNVSPFLPEFWNIYVLEYKTLVFQSQEKFFRKLEFFEYFYTIFCEVNIFAVYSFVCFLYKYKHRHYARCYAKSPVKPALARALIFRPIEKSIKPRPRVMQNPPLL